MADKTSLAAPKVAVAAFDQLPHFQYNTPTITATALNGDTLVLDAAALNAYIRRAESAYGRGNVTYCIGKDCPGGGKAAADVEADTGQALVVDCSGFAHWVTYRKQGGLHREGVDWVAVTKPIPGASTRYDPKPGRNYGHSGFIIAPGANGNFETLDSTDATNPPRKGSIVYTKDGQSRWVTKGGPNPRFLVSTEALISRNGVPNKPKLNLLLAAAKHPIATVGLGALFVAAVAGFFWYRTKRVTA